jgi:gliding motility-associated-like protein
VWSTTATTTSIIISPTTTTNYSVTSTGVCGGTATVTVNVNPGITALITGNITICGGSSTTLTASGGSNYSWNNGLTTSYISITPTATTTYSVIVSGGNCSDTASVTVNVSASPTVAITGNTTICGGNSTTLIASGGGNYLWTTGATSASVIVSPTSTTNYFVTASNGNCSSTASVTVTISNGITAAISGNTNLCKGEVATLTASGGGTYLWSSGQTTAVINPSTAGSYSVLVTAGSCSAAATAVVTVNPIPAVTVSPNIIITQGQNTNLSASGGTNYVWDNGMNGGNITVSPSGTTVYCVTVYDANTCHDAACVTVIVELCSTAGTLYLPNAFSPNGDGANDSLQIYYGIPQCIKDFHIVIYNRWGERVYETYDPAFRWGGVYNKAMLQNAGESGTVVFTYYMDVTIMDGTHISRKGNISLIR